MEKPKLSDGLRDAIKNRNWLTLAYFWGDEEYSGPSILYTVLREYTDEVKELCPQWANLVDQLLTSKSQSDFLRMFADADYPIEDVRPVLLSNGEWYLI